jgi:hypothetical protein
MMATIGPMLSAIYFYERGLDDDGEAKSLRASTAAPRFNRRAEDTSEYEKYKNCTTHAYTRRGRARRVIETRAGITSRTTAAPSTMNGPGYTST